MENWNYKLARWHCPGYLVEGAGWGDELVRNVKLKYVVSSGWGFGETKRKRRKKGGYKTNRD